MKRAVVLFLFAYLFALDASAQTTAQVSGRVTDATGAALPGAQVQITNTDTSAVRTTLTAEDGYYLLPALTIGPYKFEVTMQGFQTFVQSGIVLQVNSNPAVNFTLQVGNMAQSVEVQADASMVETQSTGIGEVVQLEHVIDLPLNGRQATQLIALVGASVQPAATSGLTSNLDYPTSVAISIAGNQINATNYFLDGGVNMDFRTNVGSPMPFPDALQEFKVESSALPANLGSRPGGSVSAITRSGTNSLHGDVFEFLRNGAMDADSYSFPNPNGTVPPGVRDNLRRNQFGGVIGGPIKRDKLFVFYGFQQTLERQYLAPVQRTIPTPATLKGDFTAYLAPPCQTSQVYLNDTVPSATGGAAQPLVTAHQSNILLPPWLNTPSAQVAAKIAALFPVPTNPCGTVSTAPYQHDNEYEHVARADWQRTNNDTLFARYFIADYRLLSNLTPGNLLSTSGVGLKDRVQNISLGDTHLISSQIVSSFRIYYGRTATQRTSNPGIPNLCAVGMLATCQVPNILSALGIVFPGNLGWDYENVYGISENIGWQFHAHHLEFGFQAQHVQMNADGTFQVNPVPAFSNGNTSYTGNSVADFITGNIDSLGQGNGQIGREGQNIPSLYINDSWKVNRRFQLNAGLRWDPFFPQHTGYKMASDFNLANYYAGVTSKVYVNAPPGLTFPGDSSFNGTSDTNSRPRDFSPRLGFVWDPRGKGAETIRAGYGIFYDTSLMWNAMHVVLNPPYGGTLSFVPAPVNVGSASPLAGGGLTNPFFGYPGGNPFPTPANPPTNFVFPENGAFVFQDQNIRPANVQQWNLSIQKQVTPNWLVSASYLGSKSSHLWLGINLNRSVIINAGMQAPGIVSTAGMVGAFGPCTLLYEGKTVTFPTCNSPATVVVNGVNNESARKALVLANPNVGGIFNGGVLMAQSVGNASYNGLLLSVQHRLSHGFSVSTNYTWSHCLDQGEASQDIGDSLQDPNKRRGEWGNCGYDRRQVFNTSLVAQTPKFGSTWMQRLVGSWNGSGIFTATTGGYATVTDGSDVSLTGLGGVPGSGGAGNDRPNLVGDPFQTGTIAANPTCAGPAQVRTILHWLNPCAFLKQPSLTFGNTPRNSLLGPGRWNFDTSIWRSFRVTEGYKLDVRAEGFNVFNHPQFGNPATSLSNTSTLGRITSLVNNPRILQLVLKMTF